MKKKQIVAAVVAATLLSVGGVAGAYAYFSGHSNMVINEFSLVQGEKDQDQGVVIVEPKWDEHLQDYPSWILAKVEMPYASMSEGVKSNGNRRKTGKCQEDTMVSRFFFCLNFPA